MKKIFIIVCVLWASVAYGTTYYVSNGGNDNYSGTSEDAAWASIQKVQSSMGSFRSGDVILFERGGVFRGGLNISISGIRIGAYGSGDKPLISGLKILDDFDRSGNVWSIVDRDLPGNEDNLHSLFINGQWYRLGRYPDEGFLYFDSYSGRTQIHDNDISFSTGYWNGAECVTRTMHYIFDRLTVSSYSGGTFNFSESATYNFGDQGDENNGYFIQNHDNTLTKNGEWNYSSSTSTLKVYYESDLNAQTVEIPIVPYGINVSGDNVTVQDIEVSNFERSIFYASDVSGLAIKNVTSEYSNYFFLRDGGGNATITECDITNIFSDGINTSGYDMTINNNNFENIGNVPGLDDGGFGYRCIYTSGNGNTQNIQNNNLKNIGYLGIAFYYTNAYIDYNNIDAFNTVLNDGGAIYCWHTTSNGRISHNIIKNGHNPDDGGAWHPAVGLYQDNLSGGNLVWEYNTLINVDHPMKINEARGGTMRYNNAYDVGRYFEPYTACYGVNMAFSTNYDLNFHDNVIVGNEYLDQVWWVWSTTSVSNVDFDNNYYISPWGDPEHLFRTPGTKYYSLNEWKSSNPYDNSWEDNSHSTPIYYSSNQKFEDMVVTFCNETEDEMTYVLNPAWTYLDIDGKEVSGSVKVSGYSSAVYFKNGTGEGAVSVTGVQINPETVSIQVNNTQQLTSTVLPSGATNKIVNWESENTNVAQVNSNGLVTAVNPGTTRISVTTEDGDYSAFCTVTVTENTSVVKVTGVNISSESETVIVGNTLQLSSSVVPSNATDKNISWSSTNPAIATVNSSGLVTAVAEGVAFITVETNDGGFSKSCLLTVNSGKSGDVVTGISVTPESVTLSIGGTQQLQPKSLPYDIGGMTYSYLSNNTNIAEVDNNGLVKGVSAGQTKIIVTAAGTDFLAEVDINVIQYATSSSENTLILDETNIDVNNGAYVQTTNITGWHEGDYISWADVDLNNVVAVNIRYSTPKEDARSFSLRIDSESGSVFLNGNLEYTGAGEYDYGIATFYLSGSESFGYRDLYLYAENINGIYLDYIELVYATNNSDNTKPVISVDFDESAYSGTIKTLDASSSFDPNGDDLTFLWSAPEGVDISSETDSEISYLVPDVYYPVKKVFNLKVSDGENTEERNIEVTFTPYKPELSKVNVVKVAASHYDGQNHPINMLDGDPSTYWEATGDNHWISMELNMAVKVSHLKVAFYGVEDKKSNFDIYVSNDETNWESLAEELESCGFSSDLHLFACNEKSTFEAEYKYVKIMGHGTDVDDNNKLAEVEVYGDVASSSSFEVVDPKGFNIYPNPCTVSFYVELQDCISFDILDIQGRVLNSYGIQEGKNEINHNLPSGIYFGRATFNNGTYHTERFIVK